MTRIQEALPAHTVINIGRDRGFNLSGVPLGELGELNKRDKLLMQRKIFNHGFSLRSMEKNLEFLFFAGFMRFIKSIQQAFPHFSRILQYTIEGDSGFGRQLADALSTLHRVPSQRLQELLPNTIADVLQETFVCVAAR